MSDVNADEAKALDLTATSGPKAAFTVFTFQLIRIDSWVPISKGERIRIRFYKNIVRILMSRIYTNILTN